MSGILIQVMVLAAIAVSAYTLFQRRGTPALRMVAGPGAIRSLFSGAVIGAVGMIATVLPMFVGGFAQIVDVKFSFPQLILGFLVFAVAAVLEEILYRGILLAGAAILIGSPIIALWCSAVLFGIVHVTGEDQPSLVSVISNSLGGVMYGLAFIRTGKLWNPIGIHFSWNFLQASLLGFPTSGNTMFSGALFSTSIDEPSVWNGGAYGPEGSWFSLGGRLIVILLVIAVTRPSSQVTSLESQAPEI